jgi:predicted MFS family arabinose efflux permease
MSDDSRQIHARPAWPIIVLAIAPAIGLGVCRFGYALVLPGMRESLGWTWSMAGLMNTVNSASYLIGALAFARLNYPPNAWPGSIALAALAFGAGQVLGPVATGAMADAFGSLSCALNISAAMLVAAFIVTRAGKPRARPLRQEGSA